MKIVLKMLSRRLMTKTSKSHEIIFGEQAGVKQWKYKKHALKYKKKAFHEFLQCSNDIKKNYNNISKIK